MELPEATWKLSGALCDEDISQSHFPMHTVSYAPQHPLLNPDGAVSLGGAIAGKAAPIPAVCSPIASVQVFLTLPRPIGLENIPRPKNQ